MKHLAFIALIAPLVGCTLPAQTALPPAGPPPPPPSATVATAQFTPEQLDQLLGPIALYPDALIALILPASTNTADVVLAARYLQAGGDPAQAESQPWDDSVQALAHYPQVIRWMDENLAWTKQLGEAFAEQPAEVMSAVQRLRGKAKAAGTLVSTPQQQVVYEQSQILIVPTQPDVIYVPYYDPAVVYVGRYYDYPYDYFGFSTGFVTGWWLSYGLDWHQHRIWNIARHDRERFWREHRGDWYKRHDWDRDWDRDGDRERRPGSRDARPPVVHTWQPRPERREWHHDVNPTQAPRVPTIARPSIPRTHWNDAPRTDISRQSTDPQRRWRTPTPAARPTTSSDTFVGPTVTSSTQVGTGIAPAANAPATQPAARPDRYGEGRGRRFEPGNNENRYPARPGPAVVSESRPPQYNTAPAPAVRPAPEPRQAPALRYSAPAERSYAPAQSYTPPPARAYNPPPARAYNPPPARAYTPPPSYTPPARSYAPPAQHYSPPPAQHYSPPPAPPPSAPAQSAPPPSGPVRSNTGNDKDR